MSDRTKERSLETAQGQKVRQCETYAIVVEYGGADDYDSEMIAGFYNGLSNLVEFINSQTPHHAYIDDLYADSIGDDIEIG